MSSRETFPTKIWWGDRDALARTAPDVWGERWSTFRSAIEKVIETAAAASIDDCTFLPLLEHGAIVGIVCSGPAAVPDLRSPLTVLRGPLEQLLAGTDDPIHASRDEIERLHRTVLHMQDLLDGPTAVSAEGQAGVSQSSEQGDRPRVLVVEDHAELRAYMAEALAEHWAVDVASDGKRALECVARKSPDLVVSDLAMEGLDGAGLFRVLRSNPRTSDIPLILITGRSAEEARIAGANIGADDYLAKPFTLAELRARVRMQLELSRVRRDATRTAHREADDFLSMIGHELRNPLATLSTTLQAMTLRESSRELELMSRATDTLCGLVDDLLETARLSRGKIQLQRRVVELQDVVDRAVDIVAPLAQERRITLSVSVPNADCRVNADLPRLARALGNVLANAIQHSPTGMPVRIEASVAAHTVRVAIIDRGTGIAPECIATLFQAFKIERTTGGLGLGLTIARSILELHGGTIALHSDGVGCGTECTLVLPRTPASVDDSPAPRPPVRRRLLLVEDNDDAARALKNALEQLGYEVALAHDAPIAMNLARTFQPDVALLDLGLPVMDGWELARRLRGAASQLPIVAVTARDQESDKLRSAELGIAEHLVKPIDLAQLQRIVDQLADQSPRS